MLATDGAANRARWAVMWIYVKGGKQRLYRKNFGDDLASAEALYHKALAAHKSYATLACVNMGFPPPVELRPHVVRKRGRDRRTHKLRQVKVTENPLKELNQGGRCWCPYCRQLRTFVFSKRTVTEGISLDYQRYICPICKVSHRDHNFRVFNPTAALHMDSSIAALQRAPRGRSVGPKRRRRRVRT